MNLEKAQKFWCKGKTITYCDKKEVISVFTEAQQ